MESRATARIGFLTVAALLAPTLLMVAMAPPAEAATSYTWGSDLSQWWSIDNAKRGEAITAAKASGQTLFFTDAKDGWGLAGWGTPGYKTITTFGVGDGGVDRVVRDAHAQGIKVAARFDIFNDHEAARRFPHAVIGGNPTWVDPACADVRAYLIGMAKDLVSRTRIDEFHFDHIRYPQVGEDGASGSARLPCTGGTLADQTGKDRVEVITSFVRETSAAVKSVRPVTTSMSIFGRAMEVPMRDIGQDAGRLAPVLDRLFPMFYPGYYSQEAVAKPYDYMYRVTKAAVQRFGSAEIVPWVQGFDEFAGNTNAVCTQMKAAADAGGSGAMVWWFASMGTSQATWKTLAGCLPAGTAPAPA
ncbi:MAG TPA: putative glycoside hydrolase, partial [Candidatus Thermoplasmatota archaeon]|nr:putative glycoside hydrolase [Candidatus Thermoplasmatota archaeon]